MTKEFIYTKSAPEPIGPYSQAVKIKIGEAEFIYTSGQIAINPRTSQVSGGDIKDQTHVVLENIRAVLQSAGSDIANVVKTTVFLKDINDFSGMNEVYSEYFGETKPARSTIEASRLPKDVKVMIEAVAVK